MIFCGNRDQEIEVEKSLVESLFSFGPDELLAFTSIPSSLINLALISEVLVARESRLDWSESLRRTNRGL